ncbi:MAG: nucleotidyltransferase domain-containing protein [Chlamydiota bacterium]|nr:nucleotidyltransferase domain-containing protein [Chlamydiota bacterium]
MAQNFGVVDIGLFGSFAKGQAHDDSDIDIIVELLEPRFEWLAGLQVYLENKFNRKIEIVRKMKNKNSRFDKRVEKEIIYA